ncbi:MAG TPA: hypothetical protein VIK75_08915 [Calditerricola sp.]
MNTTTVQIPLSVYRVLEDRDVWGAPEYRDLQVSVRGTRAYITGDTATLSALGDYVDGLAGLVADRVVTGTGISARRWAEIAKRFPLVVAPATETTNTTEGVSLTKAPADDQGDCTECHDHPATETATESASPTEVPSGDLDDCTECYDRPAIAEVLVSTAAHVKHICGACLRYVYDGSYGSAYIRHTSGRVEIIKR